MPSASWVRPAAESSRSFSAPPSPTLKAVVAQVPSGVIWPGGTGSAAAWTREGMDLPYMPWVPGAFPKYTSDPNGGAKIEHDRPVFQKILDEASPDATAAATIHAEAINGPVLLLSGDDDQLWPSCVLAAIARDRLDASGHSAMHGDESYCYPAGGHAIPVPATPTGALAVVVHPVSHAKLALGGTPEGAAHAARDAFERKRAFLARALGGP
jgi:hypothetical protein